MVPELLISSAYLPPVDYLLACYEAHAEHRPVRIEACEHYQKQTYRNRCIIGTAQGALPLVVPVIRPSGHYTMMRDVQVDYSTRWVANHLRSLHAAYGKCAFFPHYIDCLEGILCQRYTHLLALNDALLRYLLESFGIRGTTEHTSDYVHTPAPEVLDRRTAFHPKHARKPAAAYYQPFSDRQPFMPNLSAVDLLFCEGPTGLAQVHVASQSSGA